MKNKNTEIAYYDSESKKFEIATADVLKIENDTKWPDGRTIYGESEDNAPDKIQIPLSQKLDLHDSYNLAITIFNDKLCIIYQNKDTQRHYIDYFLLGEINHSNYDLLNAEFDGKTLEIPLIKDKGKEKEIQ